MFVTLVMILTLVILETEIKPDVFILVFLLSRHTALVMCTVNSQSNWRALERTVKPI